ncbi:MAG: TGS domain-containing protein [Candidatus Methanoliparum thermophilum]|uniref:TGS domain-containing protein n=1 Tax=Methanoliparum thermophilum TaxID=2491083 RepID=A0A520KU83_METT2|nr:GTPase [Candidatus Methanoliparum sp. LAM-1]RZN65105.1 MAG: TGS domain-containing protein [Candidatus Methanoliparum thermophilum]BDC36002.1 GTP-binding protein [Candidatus Methanoliparum sp. LAM-1]
MKVDDQIEEIIKELKNTPYNKATEHHIGRLKAKLARLREESEKRSSSRGPKKETIRRVGDATVILIGPPSVGKSTLFNKLTYSNSEVGTYDFTTVDVISGVLRYKGAKIQILDVPGLIKDLRGMGRMVASYIRASDLIVIMTDPYNLNAFDEIEEELYNIGIRLNRKRTDISIKKKLTGGIKINSTVEQEISDDVFKEILKEYKIHNAEIIIRENIDINSFIDALHSNRTYIKCIKVINKIDLINEENKRKNNNILEISAEKDINLNLLKETILNKLDLIPVYMKKRSKVDYDEPIIIKRGSTVEDVCERIHKDFVKRFKYARVVGSSVKYDNQKVGLSHVLDAGDILTIVLKR